MSIIAFEGFDFYGTDFTDTETGPLVNRELWYGRTGLKDPITVLDRNGGKAVSFEGASWSAETYHYRLMTKSLSSTRIITGLAFMFPDLKYYNASTFPRFLMLDEGTDTGVTTSGVLHVAAIKDAVPDSFVLDAYYYPDAGTFRLPGEFRENIWHYIEVDIKIDDPTHLKIWVNNALLLDDTGISSIAEPIDRLGLNGREENTYGNPFYYDDLYILDDDPADGAQFQDRLGPISIIPSNVSGDGTSDDMTALGGGDKYVEVNETPGPSDLDTSYVYGTQSGDTQTFTVSGVGTTHPIIAVSSSAVVKKPDLDTTTSVVGFVQTKGGNTDRESSGIVLQDAYKMTSQVVTALPDASPLTAANVEATEWGIDIT